MTDLIFVHGYNVSSTGTYGVLPARLRGTRDVGDIRLARFVTLDDEITVDDLAAALDAELRGLYGRRWPRARFALVTHSTGGLVAAAWIRRHATRGRAPLSHHIALSAPVHGSRLATIGRSRLDRLKPYDGRPAGLRILDALAVSGAHHIAWAHAWAAAQPAFYSFAITGQFVDPAFADPMTPAVREPGSDGAVRVASANLSATAYDVRRGGARRRSTVAPLLVVPGASHTGPGHGLLKALPRHGESELVRGIEEAVSVRTPEGFAKLGREWAARTAVVQRSEPLWSGGPNPAHAQLVCEVVDMDGCPLADAAVALAWEGAPFPADAIVDAHRSATAPFATTFYVDTSRLPRTGRAVVSAQVSIASPFVAYEPLMWSPDRAVIRPNETVYVRLRLHRRVRRGTFKLGRGLARVAVPSAPARGWV